MLSTMTRHPIYHTEWSVRYGVKTRNEIKIIGECELSLSVFEAFTALRWLDAVKTHYELVD